MVARSWIMDSSAYTLSPFRLANDLHRVSIYAQIAGTLPQGMHDPFNG